MKGAKPPYGDLRSKLRLSPQNTSYCPVLYARHRSFSPKPPSEHSPNPKTWGNWEGIGDFCLQKCQRGRQLSPLSEATRLDRSSRCSLRKTIKKRGVAPFGDWLCQFRLSPKNKGFGCSESFVFLFYPQKARNFFCYDFKIVFQKQV